MVRAAPGPLLRKIAPAVLLIVQALSVASSVVGLPFKMPTENLQELKDMANNMDEFLRCMPCFDGEEEELPYRFARFPSCGIFIPTRTIPVKITS